MIISTCSFGSSGSSAVSDYLHECEGVQVMDKLEFVLATMTDGLEDLEFQLMIKNPRQSSSIDAIQRFKAAAMACTRGWYKRTGLLPNEAEKVLDQFIENITQVKYVGFSNMYDKKHSEFLKTYLGDSLIRRRIIAKLERKGVIKENVDFYPLDTVRMSVHPENFYEEAKKMTSTLLEKMGVDLSKKVVLDQAFLGSDPSRSMPFYEDSYAVVVDRDPRDM